MSKCERKYLLMKQKDMWKKPSETEQKVIALETKLEKLSKDNKSILKKAKKVRIEEVKVDKKNKSKKTSSKRKEFGNVPSFKDHVPKGANVGKAHFEKDNDGNKIGKAWFYCSKEAGGHHDGRWVRHDPKKCQANYKHPKFEAKQSIMDDDQDWIVD